MVAPLAKVFQSSADDAAQARFCDRQARQASVEPEGFFRALRAGDGVSGRSREAELLNSTFDASSANDTDLCPGTWFTAKSQIQNRITH